MVAGSFIEGVCEAVQRFCMMSAVAGHALPESVSFLTVKEKISRYTIYGPMKSDALYDGAPLCFVQLSPNLSFAICLVSL